MAGPRVTRCLVVYCVAFAAAAIASRADGVVYEKIPLGAIFEQGSDEVQTAFKLAVFKHNQNNTERRFELQAYVDVIKTADAFKLSKLNVPGITAKRKTRKNKRVTMVKTKKKVSARTVKKTVAMRTTKNKVSVSTMEKTTVAVMTAEKTVAVTTTEKTVAMPLFQKPSRWFGLKTTVNVGGGPATAATALSLVGCDGGSDNGADNPQSTSPSPGCKRPFVTVTRVQDQTTDRGSDTLRCQSFTPRTAVRPRTTATDDNDPRPSSARWTCELSTCPQHSEPAVRRRTAVTLSTCAQRTAVDPMTKWFMKMTNIAGSRIPDESLLRSRCSRTRCHHGVIVTVGP